MKLRIIFFLLILVSVHLTIYSQKTFDQTKSPDLAIKEWVGDASSLKNKTIILEFWATWCGGCIDAIPHLNEMAEKYGSKDVIFVSMNSFDKKEKIEKFLQKTEMKTYIAIDDEKKTYDAFEVGAMPKTYLVDKNGNLRWQGVPGLLTDEFMQAYLERGEILMHEVVDDPLLYSLNISLTKDRSVSNISATMGDKFGFTWRNRGITDIIFQSYSNIGLKKHEFRFEGKIPLEPALDIEFKADKSIDEKFVYNDIVNKLMSIFDFTISTTKEEIEIWYLAIHDKALFEKSKSEDQEKQFSYSDAVSHELKNCEAYRLVGTLKEFTDKIIIGDELKNPIKYDCTFPKGDIEEIAKTLKEKYGLSLEKKIEEVEVRVIHF